MKPQVLSKLLWAILLVALNLRLGLTGVSPLIPQIGQELHLSGAALTGLTTWPVFLMGIGAPLALLLVRRWGEDRAILFALVLLALVQLLRPFIGPLGFLAGTALLGMALGILGTLLPALVKRDFAQQTAWVTGLYTMALSLGAAVAAGVAEPLRLAFGGQWQWSLFVWAIPALLAALIWGTLPKPASSTTTPPQAAPQSGSGFSLLRQPLAWYVTAFLGLQSALAYSVFGWLPSLLIERGLGPMQAGMLLSVTIIVSTFAALLAPGLSSKMKDERGMNALTMLCYIVGMAGCWYAPSQQAWLWASVLGLGLGGGFAMALALLAWRAPNPEIAGRLSALAQGIGFVIAAIGPLGVGLLLMRYGWGWAGLFLELIALASLWAGLQAGRPAELKAI